MRIAFLLTATLLVSTAAAAQQLTLDLGLVNSSGNSNVTSLNVGDKLSWAAGRVILTQNAKVLYGRTEGVTTSESYDAGARAQYPLSKRIGVYALVAFQRDPFAGVASRWAGGPGLSAAVLQTPHDTLGVETGITEERQRSTANVTQSFAAERTAASYKHLFQGKAFATQTLELIANLETMDDLRLNSETALTAPLSKQVGLRVSYVIRFDNQPEPGFKTTDRILTTGVQIAF